MNTAPLRAALLLAVLPMAVAADAQPAAQAAIDRGVREAFLFAFPAYQIARTRANAFALGGRAMLNRFGHRTRLATPTDRAVTTPNNDTLYSSAWLDLTQGPVTLRVPALPDRYHSVALMDVFTANFAVLGTSTGGRGGTYLVTPPGWRGAVPAGVTRVAAPTRYVWALARILVDGEADLPAATAAQARFTIDGPETPLDASAKPLPAIPEPQQMLAAVATLLGRSGVPAEHAAAARRAARYGVTPGQADPWASLSPAVRESWTRQFPQLLASLRQGFAARGTAGNGWSYPPASLGTFGSDFAYRSAVALGGLAALPTSEALYLSRAGAPGRCATVTVPPVPMQARGFWSLSMYEVTPEGQQFFVANPISRYAIGDRTPGLVRAPDGSVRLHLGPVAPAGAGANWLPAPAGRWSVTFRIYRPSPAIMRGRWSLPAWEEHDCAKPATPG